MAFEKRTWLARIGTGLNKFIIGAKDANNKQTLENSPDSVTQQGDVISADNLNDLEDRIEAGLNSMKLTKIWENENPDSQFSSQTVTINEILTDVVIEYKTYAGFRNSRMLHIKDISGYSANWISEMAFEPAPNVVLFRYRKCEINTSTSPVKTTFDFGGGAYYYVNETTVTSSNGSIIPIAIYKVGDIYNS